jgi:hypothetical protein
LNSDAAMAAALMNSTYQLTLSLVDNYSNRTTLIASGVDPYSNVYVWEIPNDATFNRRAYIAVSGQLGNFTDDNASVCNDSPQIAGPFTILNRQQPSFFITGPDPGIGQNNTDTGFQNGTGNGLLQSVPMGRFFYNVVGAMFVARLLKMVSVEIHD